MCLRDARYLNLDNSLLAMMESNLANGSVYFNSYPNFSISTFDPNILDTFTLTVKSKNMNFVSNSRSIAVVYRVYYKVMTTTLNPKAKHTLTRNETLVFEANS